MQSNLFISLLKNKPEGKITPTENFLTEIFAFVLGLENGRLLKFILQKILDNKYDFISEKFDVITQFPIKVPTTSSCKRPDISIESDKIIILVENKVESSFGMQQTGYYKTYLRGPDCIKKDIKVLIVITKYPQDKSRGDKDILWSHVYKWIDEWKDDFLGGDESAIYKGIINMFLQFLEEFEMKPIELPVESKGKVEKFIELDQGIRQAIRYIEAGIKEKFGWKKYTRKSVGGQIKDRNILYYWFESGVKTPKEGSLRITCVCDSRKDFLIFKIWLCFRDAEKFKDLLRKAKEICGYSDFLWGGVAKDLGLPKEDVIYNKESLFKSVNDEVEKLVNAGIV